jgi:hypothetical protein
MQVTPARFIQATLAIAVTAFALLAVGGAPRAQAADCTTPPTISGTESGGFARFGHQLSGTQHCTVTMLPPGSTSLDWFVCDQPTAATCDATPAASGPTYTPVAGDIGRYVRLVESGTDLISTESNDAFSGRVKGRPPTAAFTPTPTIVKRGQTIDLNGSASSDPDSGQTLTYQWDLDGGGGLEHSSGPTPSASTSFSTPGVKTLRLQVTDSDGDASAIVAHTVRVKGPPSASFVFSPGKPLTGDSVTFTSTSKDPDGDALSYAWDLDGDGAFDDGNTAVVHASYAKAGSYTATLRVTADGETSTVFRTVEVAAQPAAPKTPKKKTKLKLLRPFPTVAIGGFITSTGVRVTLLRVRAPKGSKVMVKCRGRGCPRRTTRSHVRKRTLTFRSFRRRFRVGARIQVYVWKKNRIGKLTTFKIRRKRPPSRSDRCLDPKKLKARRCPR